nr:hypothetical protein [Tanacetum cinerariifolium]
MGEDSKIPIDSHHTPIVTQPSTSSQPQQKQKSKNSKKRIIDKLKKKSEKLEKKTNKKTYKLKIFYKIGSSTSVKSSKDAGLDDQEDASKQGRMIVDLDANKGVALVDETQGMNDQDMFDTSIFDDEEVVAKKTKGIMIQEPCKTPTPTPIDSSQQSSKAKDKGKGKMIEPKKPLKRKYQNMIDEEVARNLEVQMQAKLEKEERIIRQKEKENNIALIEL